jgi:D-sedoheptulose 7-phosphate isomerase
MKQQIQNFIRESIEIKKRLVENEDILTGIEKVINLIATVLSNQGKIMVFGNGGSAADAQHFAGEIVGRYKKERKAYPAISLSTDTSVITSVANDYSFDSIFSRQIEALGKKGDIAFGISTSGNSKNVIEGIKKAKELDINTVCLLGRDGGKLKDLTNLSIIVPSDNTPSVQEAHILIIHIICEEVEKILNNL